MVRSNISQAVSQYETSRDVYKALAEKAAGTIHEMLVIEGVNFQDIHSRAKTVASFREKLERKSYRSPLKEVTDLAGIRVICYVESDVQRVCKIIEAAFTVDPSNSSDKARGLGTDRVGYRSVHFVARFTDERLALPEYRRFHDLLFEIQVRTILQHAWAEIEHDRNYKFGGVLPDDIRRRFSLLAGVLEMADREFETISADIDRYAAAVADQTEAGDLNISLTTSALREYLSKVFHSQVQAGFTMDFGAQSDEVIKELQAFGVHTLEDLDSLIPEDIRDDHSEYILQNNLLGLLRDIMIVSDAERYFSEAWQQHWHGIDGVSYRFLRERGVPVGQLVERYDLDILD